MTEQEIREYHLLSFVEAIDEHFGPYWWLRSGGYRGQQVTPFDIAKLNRKIIQEEILDKKEKQ